MRKYQAIWIAIKRDGKCTVAIHPSLHSRLKRAVCKEKYNDISYKVSCDIAGLGMPKLDILEDPDNKNVIKFVLVKPVSIYDL